METGEPKGTEFLLPTIDIKPHLQSRTNYSVRSSEARQDSQAGGVYNLQVIR